MLTPHDWHQRFIQQAGWTQTLREYLYQKCDLDAARRILDVGCGTGVIAAELSRTSEAEVTGLDIDQGHLVLAQNQTPTSNFIQGDARYLPLKTGSYDVSLCHFLLLWVNDPVAVVNEMRRVTRSGGWVLALAEPDYGGRLDYPDELAILGKWQSESLRRQGADSHLGRRLPAIFHQAGLVEIESGILGGQWGDRSVQAGWQMEWDVLTDDLQRIAVPGETLKTLQNLDQNARARGERVLFVPTFYAAGRVPYSGTPR